MEITLSHSGINQTLTFPVLEENGTPLFSVDIGKPELNIYENGELEPRFLDTRAALENYTITSQLRGQFAYADAIRLADIIKSQQGTGNTLTLELSGTDIPDAYPTSPVEVAPAVEQDEALSLTYSPGRRNVVDVELSLTRVNQVRGTATQEAATPTASGTGPLTLSNVNNETVTMSDGLVITRSVGRPNTTIRPGVQDYPQYTDHQKSAYDAFDIQFELVENAQATVVNLARKLIQPQLGRDALTLDFQGLFNMGEFSVVPSGSQALRFQRNAGTKNIENVPTLSLRRVRA